jgi:hypothetical protein
MPGASCWPSSWPSCCAALRGRQRVDELLPVRWPRPSCCAALRGRHGPGARPELAKLLPAARPPAVELAELLPAAGRRAAAGRPAPGRRAAADGARPPAAGRPAPGDAGAATHGFLQANAPVSCRATLPIFQFLQGNAPVFCRKTLPFELTLQVPCAAPRPLRQGGASPTWISSRPYLANRRCAFWTLAHPTQSDPCPASRPP